MIPGILGDELRVINVGLELFVRALEAERVAVVDVDWRPPAGDAAIAALLARLDDEP